MSLPALEIRLSMQPPVPDLESIVRRHQIAIWRYLRALGAAGDVAEDVLQDTFLVAFRRLHEHRGEAAVATFLRLTARHLYLRRRRDQGRREQLLIELADQLWQRDCATDDGDGWLAALRACVGELQGRARQVVDLFYGEGRDRGAVALALGMKEAGVKTLLQRVRATLRRCIELRIGGEA